MLSPFIIASVTLGLVDLEEDEAPPPREEAAPRPDESPPLPDELDPRPGDGPTRAGESSSRPSESTSLVAPEVVVVPEARGEPRGDNRDER